MFRPNAEIDPARWLGGLIAFAVGFALLALATFAANLFRSAEHPARPPPVLWQRDLSQPQPSQPLTPDRPTEHKKHSRPPRSPFKKEKSP